ncbi:hypothetical protein HK104_011517 [Borealophlyctis nickersoniae]|nr:hypothetical protein HK104_011517 [Borealophlyctis nickersoniae]
MSHSESAVNAGTMSQSMICEPAAALPPGFRAGYRRRSQPALFNQQHIKHSASGTHPFESTTSKSPERDAFLSSLDAQEPGSGKGRETVGLIDILKELGTGVPSWWKPVDKVSSHRTGEKWERKEWDVDQDGVCVFIYNLPFGCTRRDLLDISTDLELSVLDMRVGENENGHNVGIGLALFADAAAAEYAIGRINGYECAGRVFRASREMIWPGRDVAGKVVRFFGTGGDGPESTSPFD